MVREFEDSDVQEPVRICARSYGAEREHHIVGGTDGIWYGRSADSIGAGRKRRGRYVGGRCFGRSHRRDSSARASACLSGTVAWPASWRGSGDVSVHGYADRRRHRRRRRNRLRDNLLRKLDQHDDVDDGPQVGFVSDVRCGARTMPDLSPERSGAFEFSPGLGQPFSRLVLPRQIPFVKGPAAGARAAECAGAISCTCTRRKEKRQDCVSACVRLRRTVEDENGNSWIAVVRKKSACVP